MIMLKYFILPKFDEINFSIKKNQFYLTSDLHDFSESRKLCTSYSSFITSCCNFS